MYTTDTDIYQLHTLYMWKEGLQLNRIFYEHNAFITKNHNRSHKITTVQVATVAKEDLIRVDFKYLRSDAIQVLTT